MFAIDHAATALVVKRRYPGAPLLPLLISVQIVELAWVVLNYLGLERTTTGQAVHSVADIQLAFMPYSHSIATAVLASFAAWFVLEKGLHHRVLARAVGAGILSHLVLDLLTHGHDIRLWPAASSPVFGLGLYSGAPIIAFVVELLYGVLCWAIFRGNRVLLAVIVLGNLANLSLFFPEIAGPELALSGHPQMVVTLVLVQIVVTLALVGRFASSGCPERAKE